MIGKAPSLGFHAAGGTRTHKRFRAMDFESIAFSSLATAAPLSIVAA
jgi:hypothetical protein